MENGLFTNFLSNLPGHLSFSTALENNPFFLQQFFRFRRRGNLSPIPDAGAREFGVSLVNLFIYRHVRLYKYFDQFNDKRIFKN